MNKEKLSTETLSDIIVHMKYARYLPKERRRETWSEIIDRYKKMMIKKFPKLKEEIEENCKYLYEKKVLPSGRALQFAGKAIERNPVRGFNCSYCVIDHPNTFKEIMFLLLSGAGVGVSVQIHHIERLPEIYKPKKKRRYLIGDNIESWAEAIGALIEAYTGNRKSLPSFDFGDIRPKGTPLKTSGGVAPGPNDLKVCMVQLQNILDAKQDGEQLTSVEVLDMVCHIASCVVSGGLRRSSVLALFSFDDLAMREYKTGDWFIEHPHRSMVNISAAILRHKIHKEEFDSYFKMIKNNRGGDPGIFWTNNCQGAGTNPCIAKGSRVNTPTGFKKIEDIDIGDKIKTIIGNEKVHSIEKNKNLPVYKVQFTNLVEQRATAGHIYYVWEKQQQKEKQLRDLKIGDKVMLFPCTLRSKKLSTQEYNRYLLIGILLGDGCYTKKSLKYKNNLKICVNQLEPEYNKNIKKLVTSLGYFIGADNKDKNYNNMNISVGPADRILKDLNLEKLYSYEKYINFNDIDSKQKAFAILNGLLVTDGNVNVFPSRSEIRFFTSSKQLAQNIVQLLLMCGLKSSITQIKDKIGGTIAGRQIIKKHIAYVIHLCGKSAFIFIDSIYDKVIHPDKKQRLKKFKQLNVGAENKWYVKVKSIKADGRSDVYDLYCKKSDTWITEGVVQRGCGEAALKNNQFCNLTSINTTTIKDQKDFNERARVAAFFGTVQATFTEFHLLNEDWQTATEKDALLGVSLAGVAAGPILDLNIKEAAQQVLGENERVAKLLGINKASRTTLQKPDGNFSCVCNCSSGIHAYHSEYYIRRIRVLKHEAIYQYLLVHVPNLVEDDVMKPTIQAVISIPVKAPDGAITRKETALQLLGRVKRLYNDWVLPGHRKGQNTHSISCTVTIKDHEWERVKAWLWENKNNYASIAMLAYDGHNYPQMPFEEITKEKYEELVKHLRKIDLTKVTEYEDKTTLQQEVACAGGACEVI